MNSQIPIELKNRLSDEWFKRRKNNGSYSLSAFARDLGISQPFLSRILKGERKLSPERQISILRKLKCDTTIVRNKNQTAIFPIEQYRTVADSLHLSLMTLINTKDFTANIKWMAKRLSVPELQVKDAIDRLITLGLLEWVGETLCPTEKSTYFDAKHSTSELRDAHLDRLRLAEKELLKTDKSAFDLRQFSALTIPVRLEDLPRLKQRIKKFQTDWLKESQSIIGDEVYQLNLQFYPVTNTKKRNIR